MARDDVIEDLYHQLSSLIRRSRELSNELHPGLSLIAHTFLNLVESTPHIQASDLVDLLGLDKSTVSRQLNQLFDEGLLDREGGRPGRRGDPLSLTSKGRRVLAADANQVRSQVTQWLADWDSRSIADFARSIERFNASVTQAVLA
ncbi:MAG TPA: MarR family winged helix-turn-helix transcriptional regulator [Acidimicrobiales bacterium]|nr:MarR family winged helix-turn-helix transcriptional regulator [Acidimicrobiales bacterium]